MLGLRGSWCCFCCFFVWVVLVCLGLLDVSWACACLLVDLGLLCRVQGPNLGEGG